MRLAVIAVALTLAAAPAMAQTAGGGAGAAPVASCGGNLAQLNQITGWQTRWARELAAIATLPPAEQATALARWRAAPGAIEADLAALRQNAGGERAAPSAVVRRVLAQVDALLAAGLAPELQDPDWRRFLDDELQPSIAAYAVFLRDVYIPAAPEGSSLARSEAGHACFEDAVRQWSSRSLTAADLETMGERYLDRYSGELTRLAGQPSGAASAILARLRAEAVGGATSRDDILRLSRDAIIRAEAAAPRAFDTGSLTPLDVRPMAEALEAGMPAGFYEQASNGRTAAYVVNLSRPTERRLMAEVIAFHEGAPGHHLAFATARSAGAFNSGFVEGWAIYAEHLADELGLYSGVDDRIGAAAKHLWASSRLIVEPGLHVHGWTRDQAIAFMRQTTPMSDEEIGIEVDRYLAMPGQSVAYMVGYDSIRLARERTEQREGTGFDLRAFHRRLLGPGPQTLDSLEQSFP